MPPETINASSSPPPLSSNPLLIPQQRKFTVLGRVKTINASGEIFDDSGDNKVLGTTTRKDQFFLRGKLITSQGEFLDEKGRCVGYADFVRGPGPAFALERVFDQTSTPETAAESKKTQILQGLAHAGMSPAEAEEIVALYLQKQFLPSPPPLPPRPERVVSSSGIPSPFGYTLTQYNVLVVDDLKSNKLVMSQYYLEILRTWAAKNDGCSIFHHFDAANIQNDYFWQHYNDVRLDDGMKRLYAPLDERLVERQLGEAECIISSLAQFNSVEWSLESPRIKNQIRSQRLRSLSNGTILQYDFILVFNNMVYEALCTRLEQIYSKKGSCSSHRPEKGPPRVIYPWIYPQTTLDIPRLLYSAICDFARRELAICDFARKELAWDEPKKSIANDRLQTGSVHIPLEVQQEKASNVQEDMLQIIEDESQCKVYVVKYPAADEWILAIVGPKERLSEAETLARNLMKEWRARLSGSLGGRYKIFCDLYITASHKGVSDATEGASLSL